MNARTARYAVPLALLCTFLVLTPTVLAQEPATADDADAAVIVPWTWNLIPDGIGPGESFRLLFVTSGTRDATATDIATYNTFVQDEAAAGHADIQPFSAHFHVLGATRAVDARVNTGTHPVDDGAGVPIYWLNGPKVADGNADLYDGTWDHADPGRLPDGEALDFQVDTLVFTGTWRAGETSQWPLGGGGAAGMLETRTGRPGGGDPLSRLAVASSETHRFYALSAVFRVRPVTPLAVGLEHILAGELTAEDGGEDLYSFEATARTQYIIEVKAELVFDPVDNGNPSFVPPHLKDPSILRIQDSNGVQVLGEQDRGGFTLNWARAFFAPAADGTYTVAVGSGAQERGGFGRYTISVRVDDHADDFRTDPLVVLQPGRLVRGFIDSDVSPGDPRLNWWDWFTSPFEEGPSGLSGLRPRRGIESLDDRDVFRIEIREAGIYRVTLFELPEFARLWFIWDSVGNLWAELPSEFVNAYSLAFDPGTYYVEVGTPYRSSGQTRPYNLLLEAVPVADEVAECAATSSTHCSLQVGQSKTGLMDGVHDRDWWSVDLEPGRTYWPQLRGEGDQSGDDDNGGTLEDPFLTLYGPSGNPLASNDNVAPDNLNARIAYTVPEDAGGRYHLGARANTGSGFTHATYTISVDEGVETIDETVDCSSTQPATCSLNVGESKRARIGATSGDPDIDAWKVEFEANKTYFVEVKGAGDMSGRNDNGGSLPDPAVSLADVEGRVIASNDNDGGDNRNARLTLVVGSAGAGAYVLFVTGGTGPDYGTGTYTVSLTEAPSN